MNKLFVKKFESLLFLLIAGIYYSCQPDEATEMNLYANEYFVDISEATAFASVLEYPVISSLSHTTARTDASSTTFKDIESVMELPNEDGNASFYIINYVQGGYIMLAADKRMAPIRAFSFKSKFPVNSDKLPGGLINWMRESSSMLDMIRELDQPESENVYATWSECEMQITLIADQNNSGVCVGSSDDDSDCSNITSTYGPLLTSEWGQRDMYNDLAPFMVDTGLALIPVDECPDGSNCCQAVTGCVATAIAQVMNYHEFPDDYNWADMPDIGPGTIEVARLMRDVGDAVDMNWGCLEHGGSGASMDDVSGAFINAFGYSGASLTEFDLATLKDQIKWNRPVILSGWTDETCFLGWCDGSGAGHAWVSDGYRTYTDCGTNTSYTYLHMNWGWNNDSGENGFYAYNNWSAGDISFNYERKMIFNIKP